MHIIKIIVTFAAILHKFTTQSPHLLPYREGWKGSINRIKTMEKTYFQPAMLAVELQHNQVIATSIDGNAGLNPGVQPGDGTGPSGPRVKQSSIWDEEW